MILPGAQTRTLEKEFLCLLVLGGLKGEDIVADPLWPAPSHGKFLCRRCHSQAFLEETDDLREAQAVATEQIAGLSLTWLASATFCA